MKTALPPNRFGATALAHSTQVSILAALVLLAAGTLAVAPPPSAAQSAPAPGSPQVARTGAVFRPSEIQMAGLRIEVAQSHRFSDRVTAEAAVGPNEDTTTPVFSPYTGRVVRLIARPGERVRRGAPLMIVEASEIVQGLSDQATSVAAVGTARAQLKLAQTSEQRQHEMFLSKAGAFKDWQQAQSDLIAAENALHTAENSLTAARSRLRLLGKTDAQIAALEQSSEPPEQTAAQASVLAPIDGIVIQRQVGLGQYITSVAGGASSPVYTIGDSSTVWIVAQVRETDAPGLALGQLAHVKVLALPQRPIQMRIAWIAASLDPNSRRLAVRGQVDNRDGALRPMMQAQVIIDAGHQTTAPAVPAGAIVFDGAQAHVWVAADDGSLALRPVRTGRSDAGLIEVIEGLAAGERVVTRGTLFLDQAAEGSQQ
jgi:cobalt-zinc-cadmium efflux system membrane fusion protein